MAQIYIPIWEYVKENRRELASLTGLFMTPVLRLLGADAALMPLARTYLSIVLIGFLFQVPSMATVGSLRCQGRPRAALAAVLSGVVVNAALAPVFIFGLHGNMAGAAWATVIAQAVSLVFTIALIQGRRSGLKIDLRAMKPRPVLIGKMAGIDAPVALTNVIQLAVFGVANASISRYGGALGIAMVGIVNTLYRLFSFPVEGISQGAQALWGYNLGAGRMDRVRPVTRHALAASTAVCVLCTLLLELFPRGFVSLFTTKDAAFLTLGARGLSIFFLGFFSYGFRVVAAQFFQSVGRPAETIVLLLGRNVLLIAGMILLPRWLALDGVLWAGTVSEVLMAVVSIPFLVGRGSPETVLSAHAGRGSQAADRGGGQAPAGPLLRRGE